MNDAKKIYYIGLGISLRYLDVKDTLTEMQKELDRSKVPKSRREDHMRRMQEFEGELMALDIDLEYLNEYGLPNIQNSYLEKK